MKSQRPGEQPTGVPWRDRLYRIIFEAETPGGKVFDVLLLISIVLSVFAVMLESVESIRRGYGSLLRALEWSFTALFTLEYIVRLISVRRPGRYATSFFGIVDLAAVLPSYLSLFAVGTHSLIVIRAFRILRIFRVFKLIQFVGEATQLMTALRASVPKIVVFLGTVLSIALLMGSVMYLVESGDNGFTSIPTSMYWAIVTMTTVGYGDISPITVLGRMIAAGLMILGYAIIAVPTGIVSSELFHARPRPNTRTCGSCMLEGHLLDANFCRACGAPMTPGAAEPSQ